MRKCNINSILYAKRRYNRMMEYINKLQSKKFPGIHHAIGLLRHLISKKYSNYFRKCICNTKNMNTRNTSMLFYKIRRTLSNDNLYWQIFDYYFCDIKNKSFLCSKLKGKIINSMINEDDSISYEILVKPTGFDFDGDVIPFTSLTFSYRIDLDGICYPSKLNINTDSDSIEYQHLIISPVNKNTIWTKFIFDSIFYDWIVDKLMDSNIHI